MTSRYGLIVIVMVLAVCFLSPPLDAACIVGELANFDIHNFQELPVSGFELTLAGDYSDKIASFYTSALYDAPTVSVEGGNTIIKWDFDEPIEYCTWIHLGVRLNPGVTAPVVLGSTLDDAAGDPIATLPFPWQRWIGTAECPGAVDLG